MKIIRKLHQCLVCKIFFKTKGGGKYCSPKCLFDSGYEKEPNGCWIWKKNRNPRGYGSLEWKGKTCRAHRVSYELFFGSITEDKYVCHTCDNPSCVNPDHLFLGSPKENSEDMVKKERSIKNLRHFHKFSWEDAEKCFTLWQSGKGALEISKITGILRETVSYLIKKYAEKYNISLPPRLRRYDKPNYKNFSREKVERILCLRKHGLSLNEISHQENIALSTCHYILNNKKIKKDIEGR